VAGRQGVTALAVALRRLAWGCDVASSTRGNITVTCLTYNRTELLERTVTSFLKMVRDRYRYRFVLLNNGSWSPSAISFVHSLEKSLAGWAQVCHLPPDHYPTKGPEGRRFRYTHGMLRLFQEAIREDTEYILHLEDDWEMIRSDTFVEPCLDVLSRNPRIGQIRLRECAYDCSPTGDVNYHYLTKEPLRWAESYTYGMDTICVSNLHWTNNPTLMRTEVVQAVFAVPSESEKDLMRQFLALGYQTAQLFPGAFVHIGPPPSRFKNLGHSRQAS